jgi:hypothetical protein
LLVAVVEGHLTTQAVVVQVVYVLPLLQLVVVVL